MGAICCHIDRTSRALAVAGPSTQLAACTPLELDMCAGAVALIGMAVCSSRARLLRKLTGALTVEDPWAAVSRWAKACDKLGADAADLLLEAVEDEVVRDTLSGLKDLRMVCASWHGAMPPALPEGVHVEWLRRCFRRVLQALSLGTVPWGLWGRCIEDARVLPGGMLCCDISRCINPPTVLDGPWSQAASCS